MANLAERYYNYWIRGFHLDHLLSNLDDSRASCRYTIPELAMKLLAGISIGLPSFNQLESHVLGGYLDGVGGHHRPPADNFQCMLVNLSVEQLEKVLDEITGKARYNRALEQTRVAGYRVVAVDGTGLFSTCSARLGDKGHYRKGVHGEDISSPVYLEHAVAVSYVSANGPNLLLDLVRIPKGEGETTTASRVMDSLFARMCRFCDIVTVDAGYAKAPFINGVLRQNKDIVVRVKQENYNIIKDAEGLFQQRPSDHTSKNLKLKDGSRVVYDIELWDEEDFTSWEQVNKPLRCIKVKEMRRTVNTAGEVVNRECIQTHLVTSCPKATVPATTIWEIAHRRWDIENSGFHFLKNHFKLEHAYTYDPAGIQALLKIFAITFNLFQLFWHRNLSCRTYRETGTMLAFMRVLLIGFAQLSACCQRATLAPKT